MRIQCPLGEPVCACGHATALLFLCRNCGADYLRLSGDPASGQMHPYAEDALGEEWMRYDVVLQNLAGQLRLGGRFAFWSAAVFCRFGAWRETVRRDREFVAVLGKVVLEDRFDHVPDRHFDDPVGYRRFIGFRSLLAVSPAA